ncbi:2'-5' RNA ligase [Candidatus Curtissbacteria bacterium RBG_16_39_7]|uniref:RNA 2',3'-cyclic phosphodiesterase n=1 Tax=Candidatus Curtissbacteria bacterium RBG_16_39_7 TaxID=1797707 RepID=A0A1F5G316_9BACT|nr:MAG: 2'-5' RNA ligase [Candidatus Curtissbacteria bacterium RBG_16_39_7]
MRTFIAIELDEETKKKILEVQKRFSSFPLALPKKEALHLTLLFLSEISEEKVSEISQATRIASQKIPSFDLEFSSLGGFPNLKLPKVVWIGLKGNLEVLFNLEKGLKEKLNLKGFAFEEEKFIPHITLGRVKGFVNKKIRRRLGEEIQRFGQVPSAKIFCNAISIFKSIPTSAGYTHTILEEIPLKK